MAVLCLALPLALGQRFNPFGFFGSNRFGGSRRLGNSGETRGSRESDRFNESGEYHRFRYNRSSSGNRGSRRSSSRNFRDSIFRRPTGFRDRNPFPR